MRSNQAQSADDISPWEVRYQLGPANARTNHTAAYRDLQHACHLATRTRGEVYRDGSPVAWVIRRTMREVTPNGTRTYRAFEATGWFEIAARWAK
jgi:hypothetical protein